MGIRKRILIGSVLIGGLLLLSGVISTLELTKFKVETEKLLWDNQISIEISRQMLDAAQEQNTALLLNIADSIHTTHDSILLVNQNKFDILLSRVTKNFQNSPKVIDLERADSVYTATIAEITDTTTIGWFSVVYGNSYYNLTGAIKDFMMERQEDSIKQIARLESNAHRATMIGIITIAATLILIGLFYHLIDQVVLSPLLKIQTSLTKFLDTRMPFKVSLTNKDELMQLRDDILRLIEKSKAKKP